MKQSGKSKNSVICSDRRDELNPVMEHVAFLERIVASIEPTHATLHVAARAAVLGLCASSPSRDLVLGLERVTSPARLGEIVSRRPVVVVVFTGLTCPACAMYRSVLEKLAELAPELSIVEYIVDYDPEPALELGITGTPATVVYIDGEPVEGFLGAIDLPELAEFLAGIASRRDKVLAERLRMVAREAKPVLGFTL